jgi:hypothetical protein
MLELRKVAGMPEAIVTTDNPINDAKKLFLSDEAFSAPLLMLANKVLTVDELQEFDATSIRLELQEAFRIPVIPVDTFDRLMAALVVFNNDMFFKDPKTFNEIANIMSGFPTDVEEFEPPEPIEMAMAIYQARLIDPIDGEVDGIEFSDEVKMYMGSILAENGYMSVPGSIREAIIPDMYLNNAGSFLADADFLPAMLDNTRTLIDDLESEMAEFKKVISGQIELVKKLPSMRRDK